MNRVEIRDAFVQHMEDNWAAQKATCPVFYKRQHDTIDLDQVGADKSFFIKFTVIFDRALQSNLGPSPFHRTSGTLEILLFGKEGSSEREQLGYLDQLTEIFKVKALSRGLHTRVPTPGRSEEHDGWCSEALRVPFFADSNT